MADARKQLLEILDKQKELAKKTKELSDLAAEQKAEEGKVRQIIAREQAHGLVANLRKLGDLIREGEVAGVWKKIEGNMKSLKEHDALFFNSISSGKNPWELEFKDDVDQKFIVQLIGNGLMKSTDLGRFLSHIGDKKRDGDFFFGKERVWLETN